MAKMKTEKKKDEKMTKAKALKILGVSKSATPAKIKKACIEKITEAQIRVSSDNPRDRREGFEDSLKIAAAWHFFNPTTKLPEQEPGTFINQPETRIRKCEPKPEYVEKSEFLRLMDVTEKLHGHLLENDKSDLSFRSEVSGRLNLLLKEINKQRNLVRKVTTESPNGTTTVEETFSSNG